MFNMNNNNINKNLDYQKFCNGVKNLSDDKLASLVNTAKQFGMNQQQIQDGLRIINSIRNS